MKAVFQTIMGLIIDDWWLAIGLLASIAVTSLLLRVDFDSAAAAWILTILTLGILILSLSMEYRKKSKSSH